MCPALRGSVRQVAAVMEIGNKARGRFLPTGIVILLRVAEIDVLGNDFRAAALVAFLVGPFPDLQTAADHCHPALGEILAHKGSGIPPSHDVNEVSLCLSVVLEVPVDSQRKAANRYFAYASQFG